MKFLDFLWLSIISIKRDKKKKYMIWIISVCSILIVFTLSFRTNFLEYLNDSVEKNIGFRSLMVGANFETKDYGFSAIKQIDNVDEVYSSEYTSMSFESSFANEHFDGIINFGYGGEKSLPNNIVGRRIKEDETGVAICPMEFYPSDSIYKFKLNPDLIIKGKDLLNTFFEITYHSYTFDGYKAVITGDFNKKFQVVGLYNNTEVMTLNNDCFVSPKDIIELIEAQESIKDEGVYDWRVVVNNLTNVEQVKEDLERVGFTEIEVINSIDLGIYNTVVFSTNIIVGFITATILVISFSYIKKKIQNQMHTIGLLKTFGYSDSIIIKKYLTEIFLISIFSLLIGLVFVILIFIVLKNKLLLFLSSMGIMLTMSIYDIFLAIMLIVLLPIFLNCFYIVNIVKISLLKLIGSEM